MARSLAFAYPALLLLAGCDMSVIGAPGTITGSGVARQETRVVGPFTKVDISAMFEATLVAGADRSVTLTVDDNLLPYVRARVVNDRLAIDFADGTIIVTSKPQKVAIVVPGLAELTARGAARILAEGVKGETFSIKSEAASAIELRGLDVGTLDVKASGAGRVTLQGKGKALTLDMSVSAKLRAMDATFESADVAILGACQCEVGVTGSITGVINGTSTLDVVGNPPKQLVKAFNAAHIGY